MGKWDKYRIAMFVIVLFSAWVAFGVVADYQNNYFDVFFIVFGLLSFGVLCFVTLLDLLGISWGKAL